MRTQTLVATMETEWNCNEEKLKDSIEDLEGVVSVNFTECNSEKYKDCLCMIAKRLKKLEDRSAIVCPFRDLRQEIEDCLEQDVTSNLIVDSISNLAV